MEPGVPDEEITIDGDTDRFDFKGGGSGAWGGVKELCRKHGSREQGVSKPGRKMGRSKSSVQRNHVGTWGTCDVVGPLLHHRAPTLEQIGALIGPLNAFDHVGETGFGNFS